MSLHDSRIKDYSSFEKAGLKNVDQIVISGRNLIVGKNGSGKTRFLKALEQEKKQDETKKEIVITLYFSEIQAFFDSGRANLPEDQFIETSQNIYPYDLLMDYGEHSFYDFLKVMENDRVAFLDAILSVIHIKATRKSEEAKNTINELNSFFEIFINRRIRIDQTNTQIFLEKVEENKITRVLPLKEAISEFSPGELMLFYLCVFMMLIKQKNPNGFVLIIDEPELHLHPRALVKMVQTLKKSENVVELWIASHSLFLVPLFDFKEIIFIKQGTVYLRNNRIYKELYDSLAGLENINIFEFLKSLNSWQYYQFIAECFCLPEAVEKANVKDEQFCKLLDSIKCNVDDQPIRMLDYGAGKCRIWECMQLLPDSHFEKSQVIYTAYEPYPEDHVQRPFKLYTNFSDLSKDKQRFHVVVLMNVLHEIEGSKWYQTFQNIKNLLEDDGILIFLEVLSLTKGEQPYGNNGYLVLQDEQVKLLFGDSDIINMRVDPKEKSNCWILTKKQVENVTKDTVIASVSALESSSYKALREEYQKRIDFAHRDIDNYQKQMSARQYAFLSQQYINAKLACIMLKGIYSNKDYPVVDLKGAFVVSTSEKTKSPIKVTGIKKENS